MTAGLALLILLAGSLVIVRIASVVLRLTGLPDHVARFQSISALTGAGFTTTESEAIVNFPVRRKVVVALMILGNLGLVSVASTIIVALADTVGDRDRLLLQLAEMAGAIVVIALFMLNKTLDRLMCAGAARILRRYMIAKADHFDVLLSVGPEHCVAVHVYRGEAEISAHKLLGDLESMLILSIMGVEHRVGDIDQYEARIGPNETMICFGSVADHRSFSEKMKAWA